MRNGLLGLRHDVVVSSHNDDSDVGDLCTTGTHGGECLVTWGVEERDMTSILEGDVVGTDMLRDSACLASNDVGLTDIVEQ